MKLALVIALILVLTVSETLAADTSEVIKIPEDNKSAFWTAVIVVSAIAVTAFQGAILKW